jgi:thiol-disulfide isomerase/thioredoxin
VIGLPALLLAVATALSPGGTMRAFNGATAWINSPPLTPQALRGKVVLVDFWEYTCINCLRTLPYLREWYHRYHGDGFVIVGVHTPEFAFSGKAANVAAAAKRLGVTWPIAVDANMDVWKRYGVNAWPTEFLFDRSGKLIESVSGEGRYPQTERAIQALLRAGNPQLSLPPVMALLPQDSYDKPGAVCYPKSDELLIEARGVANAPPFQNPAQDVDYVDAGSHKDGLLYLDGYWRRTDQAVISAGGNDSAALEYHAIQVVAVMKPQAGKSVRVVVTQDGKPVARADAGADLRYDDHGNSYVQVDAPRAYDLVMNARFGTHLLRLQPQGYGLGLYDVAFESCEVPQAK